MVLEINSISEILAVYDGLELLKKSYETLRGLDPDESTDFILVCDSLMKTLEPHVNALDNPSKSD